MMSRRHEIAPILARDPRYTIEAYALVLQALDRATRQQKRSRRGRSVRPGGSTKSGKAKPNHVTGRQLCLATRDLVLEQYGLLGFGLLARWGLHSTSDIGEIVYTLIASGDLTKTDKDSRTDFDNVFEFQTALRDDYRVAAADDQPSSDLATDH